MTKEELETLEKLLYKFSGEVMGNHLEGVISVLDLVRREVKTRN